MSELKKQVEVTKKGPAPKAVRFPEERFCSQADFELHTMACDQIDANLKEAREFYMKPMNAGFVMLPNGGRKQFFMK